MLDFLVLYSSNTGNTRMVATSIFNAIPGTSKELCDIKDFHYDKEANLYFIGFWTNRGSCDISIINLLASLHPDEDDLVNAQNFAGDILLRCKP